MADQYTILWFRQDLRLADNPAPVMMPLPAPTVESLNTGMTALRANNLTVDDLGLLPHIPWDKPLSSCWHVGEVGAHQAKQTFFESAASDYDKGRNYPARQKISRLSPHLHWGEISPRQLWHAAHLRGDDDNIERFKTELGWREFSYYQLYHCPTLMHDNLQKRFDVFPWQHNEKKLTLWQQGNTGYPIVDIAASRKAALEAYQQLGAGFPL